MNELVCKITKLNKRLIMELNMLKKRSDIHNNGPKYPIKHCYI